MRRGSGSHAGSRGSHQRSIHGYSTYQRRTLAVPDDSRSHEPGGVAVGIAVVVRDGQRHAMPQLDAGAVDLRKRIAAQIDPPNIVAVRREEAARVVEVGDDPWLVCDARIVIKTFVYWTMQSQDDRPARRLPAAAG